MHICSMQVAAREAISCPAFPFWDVAAVHAPPIRFKEILLLPPPPLPHWNVEKWKGKKVLEVRWEDTQGERETETKSERVSCGLNSDQLFKACACSWVWAALIKDAVSEQATDAREGGRNTQTHGGEGASFFRTTTKQKKKKKVLDNNYRSCSTWKEKWFSLPVSIVFNLV